MSEEWCQERLKNLKIEDRRSDTLNELKTQISTLREGEESVLDSIVNSSNLFDCLSDLENSTLACDVLSMCMNNLSLEKTIKNTALLERILKHPQASVKTLGVNEISRIIRHSPNGITDINIIICLIECLKVPETSGSSCIPLLAKILPAFIENNAIRSNLEQTLTLEETIRCRTFEVGVLMARESPKLLDQVQFILQKLIAEIDNPDILYQLNVLELLSELPTKQHGLVYLENTGVFNNLLRKIETISENPLSNLLIPGLMKFFGNVGSIHPSKVFGYSTVVNSLFECIKSNDYTILPTAFDTLGYLGRSADGKKQLDDHRFRDQMNEFLCHIGGSIMNLPTELKIRALECISSLLYVHPDEENNQISVITETWYERLTSSGGGSNTSDTLNFIMAYAKNPFPDIKGAAFNLLRVVISHKWGQEKLNKTGGLVEFLLDRNAEFDKDLIQAKYEIIKSLADSNIFDASTLVQFRKYVTEGAFYVHGVTEVAIEGAS